MIQTPLDALKAVTKFTEETIAPTLLMRKEVRTSGDIMDKSRIPDEFVHPAVTFGTIPHKNFQPLELQCPMILWTFDEVGDSGSYTEGRKVNMRAYVSAYSSELYEGNTKLPDNKAFIDLVNVLERMATEITRKHVINGVGIEKKIDYGVYDGAYYPYAYGWLTITAEIPRMQYDDEVNLDF